MHMVAGLQWVRYWHIAIIISNIQIYNNYNIFYIYIYNSFDLWLSTKEQSDSSTPTCPLPRMHGDNKTRSLFHLVIIYVLIKLWIFLFFCIIYSVKLYPSKRIFRQNYKVKKKKRKKKEKEKEEESKKGWLRTLAEPPPPAGC